MSDDTSYATEEVEFQGTKFSAGDVVRLFDGAFSDAVILGFTKFKGEYYAKLARPYAYASSVGTTCANPLLGYEEMSFFPVKKLWDLKCMAVRRIT